MSRTKRPTKDQLLTAAEWLKCNEGEEGNEREDCMAVALWLERQAENAELRDIAKEGGVSAVLLRAAAKRREQKQFTR